MVTARKRGDIWHATVSLDRDTDGKYRRKSFSHKKKSTALEMAASYLKKYKRGVDVDAGSQTVAEYAPTFLNEWKEATEPAASTVVIYERNLSSVLKVIGGISLNEVGSVRIKEAIQEGAPSSQRMKLLVLRLLFNYALRTTPPLIEANPCNPVHLKPIKRQKEPTIWSKEEISSIIEAAKGRSLQYAVQIMFVFGLRVGELMALRWSDIDFGKREIHIRHQIRSSTSYSSLALGDKALVPTKGKEERTLPLDSASLALLQKIKQEQEFLKQTHGKHWANVDAVVPLLHYRDVNGRPTIGSFYAYFSFRTQLEPILIKARILTPEGRTKGDKERTRIPTHSFRHSCAANLLSRGSSIEQVSHYLGHKSIQVTIESYGHLTKDALKGMSNLLSDVISA